MPRFEFGRNWRDYLAEISEKDIQTAIHALTAFLGTNSLTGRRFLDIGCGSGVHSLAALRLGASEIVSIDYDPLSVDCTRSLKEKEDNPASWRIFQWDILSSQPFPERQPFDVVYAWGVLHHTGDMWRAIDQSLLHVNGNGLFYIAIYNKHWTSPFWKLIKRLYCVSPRPLQRLWFLLYASWETMKSRIRGGPNPSDRARGMKWYSDLKDWLGGYPYEYAAADEIISAVTSKRFVLLKSVPNTGTGCSEFLFQKKVGP